MELLRSYLRRHFAGKPPVESRNVGCFLRLQPNMLFLQPPSQVLRFSHRGGERETRVTREWLATKRRGSRKGEKREAKPVFSFPPSFVRIERETSGYVAAISQFQKPSLWKWGQVQNFLCEIQFYLNEKNQLISHLRLSTYSLHHHTNVSKLLRLCKAISWLVFNKSLSVSATLLILRRSLLLCWRIFAVWFQSKNRGRI